MGVKRDAPTITLKDWTAKSASEIKALEQNGFTPSLIWTLSGKFSKGAVRCGVMSGLSEAGFRHATIRLGNQLPVAENTMRLPIISTVWLPDSALVGTIVAADAMVCALAPTNVVQLEQ